MKMTHAPGQWVVKNLSVYTDYGAGHRHKVADTRQPLFTRECQKANAALIAAAPELLAVLSRILYAHETRNCGAVTGEAVLCGQFEAAARDAIAKAQGGAP